MVKQQIIPPNLQAREDLIRALIECAAEPWDGNTNWVEVGKYMGLTPNAVRKQYKRLDEWLLANGYTMRQFAQQVSEGVNNTGEDLWDEADWLRSAGYDPNLYTARPKSVWTSGGQLQRSFVITPKTTPKNPKTISDFVAELSQFIGSPPIASPVEDKGGYMAVFNVNDAHIGKLALSGRDMVEDYKMVMGELIKKASIYPIGRPVLIVGQDYANYDTVQGTTSAGTPQTSSLNWQDLILAQIGLLAWTVDRFVEAFGKIELHFVAGNHDQMQNFWLKEWAKVKYQNSPVVIEGNHDYSCILHGKVGIMVLHGHAGKPEDWLDIWAKFSPDTWAYSTYREIHTGHLHTRKEVIFERHGVVFRYMPGLTDIDEWHKGKLYIGNNRLGICTLYDETGPAVEVYAFPG